ncbi:MAG: hypothetical protein IH595_02745 [Bacteroidales bacterium]|nr:hypothetical protein [Bacteroidales bacterium]
MSTLCTGRKSKYFDIKLSVSDIGNSGAGAEAIYCREIVDYCWEITDEALPGASETVLIGNEALSIADEG